MKKANLEIRIEARRLNIPLWKLAEHLGVSENTVIRKLRRELPLSDKTLYLNTLKHIAATNVEDLQDAEY